jgi:glycosyltransferase involved in cell wall biosynthesis
VDEPLVQTQVIAYLQELAKRDIEMHLLTFERERHSTEKREAIRSELSKSRIHWHSRRYHKRPSLIATLYDVALGTLTALRICRRHQIEFVHARSHVPAAMALMLKRMLGCRFLFDMRGLLAEEYVDAGHWKEGNIKFRLTKRMERVFFRRGDAFVMLTHRINQWLLANEVALRNRAADIEVIPCCVDTSRFDRALYARASYRQSRGWSDRRVITYVGKLGTWYLPDEMARFFVIAKKHDARFFFQVLTQSNSEVMRQALDRAGANPEDYDIRFASVGELPAILAASDAGLSFIRASFSKRASSPTKIAEYLAAGLPVITSAGIGDCDEMIGGNGLGVIAREFSNREYLRAANALCLLLDDETTVARCLEFAERELSLSGVGGPRYSAVYERLLDAAAPIATQQSVNAIS